MQESGIVSFAIEGVSASNAQRFLRSRGLLLSVCSTSRARLDEDLVLTGPVLRASPHYFNSAEDVDALAVAVDELVRTM